jgi:hypothetical protein
MSLQQGGGGIRSFNTRRNAGFFVQYGRSPNIFGAFQRPAWAPVQMECRRWRRPGCSGAAAMVFLADLLTGRAT